MSPSKTLSSAAVIVMALAGLTACSGGSGGSGGSAADSDTANTSAGPAHEAGFDASKITVNEAAAAMLPQEIKDAGKIVVGVDPTYAPNEFKDAAGIPVGWEIDIIDAAAARLGITADYRSAAFDTIVPNILQDQYDLGLGGYYDTKARQETLDFIDYFSAGNQFASPADKPITQETDICGLKVGAPKGGSAVSSYLPRVAEQCTTAGLAAFEVLEYDTQDQQTAALKIGTIDAMVSDSPVTSYAVRLSEGAFVGSPLYDVILSGAPVKKDRGQFAEALRQAMQDLLDDGTYAQILAYWGVQDGAIDAITVNASTAETA
jgi:polar amino acid transport system substrate-binding protein